MATIHNEIIINASIEKIWTALTDLELLDKYDPTVKKSTLLSAERTGIGAKRKVLMLDGKNWFDEKVTEFKPNQALTYELTACSFPVHKLNVPEYSEETRKASRRLQKIRLRRKRRTRYLPPLKRGALPLGCLSIYLGSIFNRGTGVPGKLFSAACK